MALTKFKDLQQLSEQEVSDRIVAIKKELFDLRFKKATRQEVKPHQFKHLRHELAQLLTLENQRRRSGGQN
ncbi:50S ribosomal protein L29 [Thermosynechococcaceae cyanobacterium Okahandja]